MIFTEKYNRFFSCLILLMLMPWFGVAQGTSNPAPYCNGSYSSGQCNQPGASNSPGNFVNDFIDNFSTTGGNTNISNLSSGCNGQANNYMNYCAHYLAVSPGQTITATIQSGITYAQGFAIFVDWNQDNTFNTTNELVAATTGVPPAATPTTITFVIPANQPNGTYRMRVRCAFATPGTNITPCGQFGFGETEDYTLYVGPIPSSSGIPTGTAYVNSPICAGQNLNFTLTTNYSGALSYTWTGPNSYSSTLQNPVISTASVGASGIYTVTISNTTCPTTATVSATVIAVPVFSITPPSYTICNGGFFQPAVSMPNLSAYTYSWVSTAPGLISPPNNQSPLIQPALLPIGTPTATYVYSVTVSPSLASCPVTKSTTLIVLNPPTPTISPIAGICDVHSPVQLSATPGGGTWSANPAVSVSGLFSPALTTTIGVNTVSYAITSGTCKVGSTQTVLVSRYNTPALSSTLTNRCVNDPPFNLMNIVQTTVTGKWTGPQVTNNYFSATGLPTGIYILRYLTLSQPDSSVCPDSISMSVQVFNPPTPVISQIQPKCTNAGTVALSATPVGGVWTGNSGVSLSGIQTPSLCNTGSNSVVYTAGQGTCVAASSRSFHVSQFRSAAILGSVPDQCFSFSPFNLLSIVQNTVGNWTGPGVIGTSNSFNPAFAPVGSYSYSLKYRVQSTPNPALCPDSSSLVVKVLHPATPKIKLAGPFCTAENPVQLSVTPATGSWVPANYINPAGVFIPSLSVPGSNPVHYVIGTSTCNSQSSIFIQTEAFVSAAISGSIADLCNTSPLVNLSPLVAATSGLWSGPGVLGTSFFPSISGSGLHTLVHSTSSYPSGLCPDQATLAVKVYSLAPPLINQVGPLCAKNQPIQLQVSPVGGVFGSGIVGLISYNGVFDPAKAAYGSNIINYSVMVGPCVAYSQATVAVEEFVPADFAKQPELAYCKNALPFNLNSLAQSPTGFWTGAGVVDGTSMFNPAGANIGSNNYIVHQTFSSPTKQCSDTKTIQITVKDIPSVNTGFSPSQGCAPLKVSFSPSTSATGKGIWNFSDGTSQEGLSVSKEFSAAGSYSMVYTFIDSEAAGCSTQVILQTPVVVYESPKADFEVYPDEIFISDPQVTLNNLSNPLTNNTYYWTIQGFNSYDQVHPTVMLPQVGTYKVTLRATSLHDCKSEVSKVIEVKNDFNVFIPNSFTPNADGLNDVFKPVFSPYGLDAKTYRMEIFDRWGKIVFSTSDFTKGWDGGVQEKGDNPTKQDSFVYKIKFKDLEGRIYEKVGNLLLLIAN